MHFEAFEQILSYWAVTTPEAPALKFEEGGEIRTLSYARLSAAVAAEAAKPSHSACQGFLFHAPGPGTLIRFLAAVKAGRQTVLLNDSTPLPVLRGLLPYTDVDSLDGDSGLIGALMKDVFPPRITDGAGKLLFFTSGTTERARAVVLTEGSLCASAACGSALLPLSGNDTLLCMLPLDHVFGFVCGLLWGLVSGACVALGRGPAYYTSDCMRFRPTAMALVPGLLQRLVDGNLLNPELKTLLVGAGDCPTALLDAAKARGIRVSFGYGLTETSSGVALSLGDDPRAMTVCPGHSLTLAEDGEILISARRCMMKGYYKRPKDTKEALRGAVLHTGDLGYFDESGLLHVTGRKKEVLVLPDGTNLFLPEYERCVAAALNETELAVVLKDGAPALVLNTAWKDREGILAALAPVMAEFPEGHRIKDVLFLQRPLPRTTSGKLKRWALQQEI